MIQHFKRLFEYDLWANTHVIESLKNHNISDSKIELLFSHILNSQQIWYSRLKGNQKGQSPWDIIPTQDFQEVLKIVNHNWVEYLDKSTIKTIEKTLEYKNISGEPFKNTIQDILTHLINHSTYHRAQISQQIKSLGKTPPLTDFIAYARTK
jgi:uncharacterized damage-inducible protein DinB